MNRLNPNALCMWALFALIGYLITGTTHGALMGLAWGLAVSFTLALHGVLFVMLCVAFVGWLFL